MYIMFGILYSVGEVRYSFEIFYNVGVLYIVLGNQLQCLEYYSVWDVRYSVWDIIYTVWNIIHSVWDIIYSVGDTLCWDIGYMIYFGFMCIKIQIQIVLYTVDVLFIFSIFHIKA